VYEVLEASTNMKPVSRQLAKQESGLEGDPAILWVGRLNANKDPLTVLDGFERTLAELPSSTLSMVFSSGGLLPEVRARLERSPALGSRVRLVGPVAHNRMAAFYSAADLFVVGSHHEGSGYAVLEAVSSGLSPVITSIPPFRVITAGGAIGMLWPPGDSRACADALVRAAAERRPEARERVLERFERDLSWRAVARSAIAAYEDACARRRSKYA
jgi:glycosyltransferase involved in cell wall biosynthesis